LSVNITLNPQFVDLTLPNQVKIKVVSRVAELLFLRGVATNDKIEADNQVGVKN
jgi:hypothetical protein